MDRYPYNSTLYYLRLRVHLRTFRHIITHRVSACHLLKAYDKKLNPLKCTFGVSADWFLGFMVTQRGIEVNPTQLKAILESPAPSSRKWVQQLINRLAALGQFISWFTDRLKPFFATLKGASQAGWNEEWDQALVAIKHYLVKPLVLASPEAGETLFMSLISFGCCSKRRPVQRR